MDDLAHKECSIVEDMVECLCLSYKSASACPMKVLCLELAEQLVGLER